MLSIIIIAKIIKGLTLFLKDIDIKDIILTFTSPGSQRQAALETNSHSRSTLSDIYKLTNAKFSSMIRLKKHLNQLLHNIS